MIPGFEKAPRRRAAHKRALAALAVPALLALGLALPAGPLRAADPPAAGTAATPPVTGAPAASPPTAAPPTAANAPARAPGGSGEPPSIVAAPTLSKLDQALRKAADDGDAQRAEALLKQGADANSVDKDGITPLMIAVVGDVENVRQIAEKGVGGAWQKGLKKVIKAMKGDAATSRVLLDHGAQVNAATPRGITPLALASLGGKPEIVQLLLERGADPNQRAKRGETALMVASVAGHNPVVLLLMEKGADPSLQTKDGITAALAALLGGHPETLQVLTEKSKAGKATF